MKIIVDTPENIAKMAAERYVTLLNKKPDAVLGLATGSTPLGLYGEIVKLYNEGKISFAKAKSFNLDEYVGLDGTHDQSYRYFMNENLFSKVDINPDETHVPGGKGDIAENAKEYEEMIAAAGGIDMAVAVGNVGLDVENRCSVHQIRASYMEDGAEFFRMLHTQQLHAGKPQVVWPERGTGGEDTHAGVAAQPGRPYRRRPALPNRFGKLPDNPQMGKILNSPQGIGVPEFRLKDDGGAQFFHKAALPGNAEFCGEIAVHPGNDLNIHIHVMPSLSGIRR